jgi:ketosteroid isomerase-like protein
MSPHLRNTKTLQEGYRLWDETKGGSIDHWVSIMAEGVSFGSLGQGARHVEFTRPRTSPADVRGYLTELTKEWAMIDYVVAHYVAQDDRVVAIGRTAWTHKRTGNIVDTPKVDVWRFDSEGKAIEFFEYYDTAALLTAAG